MRGWELGQEPQGRGQRGAEAVGEVRGASRGAGACPWRLSSRPTWCGQGDWGPAGSCEGRKPGHPSRAGTAPGVGGHRGAGGGWGGGAEPGDPVFPVRASCVRLVPWNEAGLLWPPLGGLGALGGESGRLTFLWPPGGCPEESSQPSAGTSPGHLSLQLLWRIFAFLLLSVL